MASLPLPTITPPALRSWPSFPNISRASINRKHNNGGHDQPPLETPASRKFGRRNVLLLIGGLYSTTTISLNAAPAAPASTAVPKVVFPVTLDKVLRVLVQRPRKSRSKREKDEEEEILVIDGIEFDNEEYVKFDVLINDDEDEKGSAPSKTEFAGSFARLPHKNKREGMKTRTCLRLGISELLEDLGADGDDALVVTLVPRSGSQDLTVAGVKIEFA
ncbi:hypothetical protein RJ639_008367 [Escallonia herrerae]|uniref:Polyphenol oxidase C-terminal domain-containing protein n=1 Tax=Escallonia herrerae TaxID=1293975 RepID=A0AA88V7A9_9ASTE|nr:hypothetical protein RJ639_020532 [Escallonia herrerae]KAK3013544.1 hypothetical protein RJ639_008367 [Escallonia herrerae]